VNGVGGGHDAPERTAPAAVAVTESFRPQRVKRALVLADLVAIVTGMGLSFAVQAAVEPVPSSTQSTQWLLALLSLPLWLASATANSLYVARANTRVWDEFKHILATALLGVGGVVGMAFVVRYDSLSRGWAAALLLSVVATLTLERALARSVFRRLRREGRLARPILVVGTDANASALAHRVECRPELGYRVLGFIGGNEPEDSAGLPLLGGIDQIEEVAVASGATGVMISLYSIDGMTVNHLSRRLTDAGLHVTLCTSLRDIDMPRLRVQELDGQALLYIEPVIRTGWRRTAMRVFDYTVASIGLILASPVLLVSAIAIKLDSPGPAFFRQLRIGENGRPFEIIKLRTMRSDAEQVRNELLEQNESDGPLFKIRNDPRITRSGRILRKLSIDEIPQFWNVIRGEMSVVGPRPALPSEVAEWDADVHERLRVMPGITGMWQVSGRAETTFEEYKRLDMYYVDNWSLRHDVRIMLQTVGVVLRGRGAS
jgi:exopolysaccharide biosynthesis polyprenyl glycosylphosphotransferase